MVLMDDAANKGSGKITPANQQPLPALPDMGYNHRFVTRLTKETLALILAGGQGTRLHELTKWNAKPAVPFGGKFRIIDFSLSNCINSGIQKGWGFLRGEFHEYIELLPAQQRVACSWYQGTADAVYQNLDIIHGHRPAYVLILAADHVYKMDYGPMLAQHVETGADLTIACIEIPLSTASAFGVMKVGADNAILEFNEKPANPAPIPGKPGLAMASMGIYVFSAQFLVEQLKADAALGERSTHDFGKDVIPALLGKHRVFAYPFRQGGNDRMDYWRDVGTLDAYWQANMELVGVSPELNLYDREWPIWTHQEQLPPCKFVFDDEGRRGMAVDSMISSGSIVSGAYIKHSLLFNDVRVEARSEIRDSVILHGVVVGCDCQIRRAIIDSGTVIPANTQIGVNLEQDQQRFHVTPLGVVLVTAAMLGQQVNFEE
jgi:glucose-1-phosphate adenylyltransferase